MWQLWDRKVRQVEVVGNGMLIIGKWHWLHPSGFSWMWSCTIAYQSWDIHCQKCLTSNDRNPYTRRIYNNHSLPGPHRQYFDQRKSSAVLSASRMTSDRNRWQNLNSPQTICLVSSLSQLKNGTLWRPWYQHRVCDIVESRETWNVGDKSWDPAAWK